MKLRHIARIAIALFLLRILIPGAARACAQPTRAALSAFDAYTKAVEERLNQQHRSSTNFLPAAADAETSPRLQAGQLILDRLAASAKWNPPGALLHDWSGTAFVPAASAASFESLLRNVSAYPRIYAPQVVQASVIGRRGDSLQMDMRVRQQHVITVVLDSAYSVTFGRLDARHGYSVSHSTRISEISGGRLLAPSEEHGFLWRMNTYWTYEEKDGGLYLQIESVSLTRSIPSGLGWAVRPFVESVPRDSIDFTLHSTCEALRRMSSTQLQSVAADREGGKS